VYAVTFVAEDGIERPAAISVGTRPTFYEDGDVLVEAYVLDFDGDLYDQAVKVRFREWIRGQERFDSVEALVEEMNADVEAARRILAV
jgi:riboflavin kinase/FMN adenylyltransferase